MRVFIIEDEMPAEINLKRALKHNFDDVEFVGRAHSVTSAVAWLKANGDQPDIIFMDVELSDGMCFEIFKQVDIKAKVIITTAYDSYAIKAFKVNSVDYLLKPIDHRELVDAVMKCRREAEKPFADPASPIASSPNANKEYKQRFAVKIGDKIVIVAVAEIAYFYSEEKTSYIVTRDEKKYIVDFSLDSVMPMLDPHDFFRLSRAYITHIRAIKSVTRHIGGRLKVVLAPKPSECPYVSRVRINEFVRWLGDD